VKQRPLFNTASLSSAREMRRLKRDRVIKQSGIRRVISKPMSQSDTEETEFNLRDEDRFYYMNLPCHNCGSRMPRLYRETDSNGPMHPKFRIFCTGCDYETPEFPSSKQAVTHWKMLSALTK